MTVKHQQNRAQLTEKILPIVAFLISFFLFFTQLFPDLRGLNEFDEAIYINSGRLLAMGNLPIFARNPLVAAFYSLLYLPAAHSPYWMVQSADIGRVILFSLLWLSGYLVLKQLSDHFSPYLYFGLVIISPIFGSIIANPSDSLFAILSAFGLWQVLKFYHTRKGIHIWLASLFVGLAACSRNDGLVLFGLLMILILLSTILFKTNWRLLIAGIIPFGILIGGYLLIYGFTTGNFTLGTMQRSYAAFKQGQGQIGVDPDCVFKKIQCVNYGAEDIYGTAEENNYSVIQAILNNPAAYAEHLKTTFSKLPTVVVDAYGNRMSFFFGLLALRGLVDIFKRRKFAIAGILLIWTLYLGSYFLTFFRYGYLQSPYFIVFCFAAMGITAWLGDLKSKRGWILWLAGLGLLAILGFIFKVEMVSFTAIPLFAVSLISGLLIRDDRYALNASLVGTFLLIMVGLVVRGNFIPPALPDWSGVAEQQAVVVMENTLPEGSLVLAGAPGTLWAAKMEYQNINEQVMPSGSAQELHQKLVNLGVKAIYVDQGISNYNKDTWTLIQDGMNSEFKQIYSGREGSILVLLLN